MNDSACGKQMVNPWHQMPQGDPGAMMQTLLQFILNSQWFIRYKFDGQKSGTLNVMIQAWC